MKMSAKDVMIATAKGRGMEYCSCDDHNHYCWCHHACGQAIKRGLIGYPPTYDPGTLQGVGTAGRATGIRVGQGGPAPTGQNKRARAWDADGVAGSGGGGNGGQNNIEL